MKKFLLALALISLTSSQLAAGTFTKLAKLCPSLDVKENLKEIDVSNKHISNSNPYYNHEAPFQLTEDQIEALGTICEEVETKLTQIQNEFEPKEALLPIDEKNLFNEFKKVVTFFSSLLSKVNRTYETENYLIFQHHFDNIETIEQKVANFRKTLTDFKEALEIADNYLREQEDDSDLDSYYGYFGNKNSNLEIDSE